MLDGDEEGGADPPVGELLQLNGGGGRSDPHSVGPDPFSVVRKKGKGRWIYQWWRCSISPALGEGRIRAWWCSMVLDPTELTSRRCGPHRQSGTALPLSLRRGGPTPCRERREREGRGGVLAMEREKGAVPSH